MKYLLLVNIFLFASEIEFLKVINKDSYFFISKNEITYYDYISYLNLAKEVDSLTIKRNQIFGHFNDKKVIRSNFVPYFHNLDTLCSKISEPSICIEKDKFYINNEKFYNSPINYITWFGAIRFAEFNNYKLPSKEQWEVAANYEINNLFNMIGSVSEWVLDLWTPDSHYSHRVIKGGSSKQPNSKKYLNKESIQANFPTHASEYVGFRVVKINQ